MIGDSLTVESFDLAATLNSGQVFHWHEADGVWHGVMGSNPVALWQKDAHTLVTTPGMAPLVVQYLALDHDLRAIQRTLPKKDKPLRAALRYSPGLRIMRQPFWECLATFITSSMKQVSHIRQISLCLRERFGEPVASTHPQVPQYAYPTPVAMAAAGEAALRDCGLGYRAAFLHQSATLIASGEFSLETVQSLEDEAAIRRLCELPGVGPKIAQCTLLFAYGRLGMFPVDVWVERILRELYFPQDQEKINAAALKDFAQQHFGVYRGYAQQWLFHHARTGGIFIPRRKQD